LTKAGFIYLKKMADTFSKQMRSRIMGAVKSKGNLSTEQKLIVLFKEKQIKGWRRNRRLFGRPDFVFPKKRIAVFADGCFWHGHNCRNISPQSNALYWEEKIIRNKKRDRKVNKILRDKNWKVFRVRECKLKSNKLPPSLVRALI